MGTATMRAAVFERFGDPDVLAVREVARPSPRANEVLIRVRATTVTAAESAMRRGRPLWGRALIGFTRPRAKFRTLGTELAGEVAGVGRDVTRFREGDRVFGFAGFDIGANAQYMRLRADASLAPMPDGASFETCAAAVDGATTALCFLEELADVRAGQRVVVVGASGSIGTNAVQLAKRRGAEVTAVCSGKNAALVSRLGADAVVDYTRDDFTEGVEPYDVIFDTVGASSFGRCRRALGRRGTYLSTTIGPGLVLSSLFSRLRGGPRCRTTMSVEKQGALERVAQWLADGSLEVVLHDTFELERIADAHRVVDTGHKRGNVAVTVA